MMLLRLLISHEHSKEGRIAAPQRGDFAAQSVKEARASLLFVYEHDVT